MSSNQPTYRRPTRDVLEALVACLDYDLDHYSRNEAERRGLYFSLGYCQPDKNDRRFGHWARMILEAGLVDGPETRALFCEAYPDPVVSLARLTRTEGSDTPV
jgi:hypothetical protein